MRVFLPVHSFATDNKKCHQLVSQTSQSTLTKSPKLKGDQVQFRGAGPSKAEKDNANAHDRWEKLERSRTASQQEKDTAYQSYQRLKKKAEDSQQIKRHITTAVGFIPGAGPLAGHLGNAIANLTYVDEDGNNAADRYWNTVASNTAERDASDRACGINPDDRWDRW